MPGEAVAQVYGVDGAAVPEGNLTVREIVVHSYSGPIEGIVFTEVVLDGDDTCFTVDLFLCRVKDGDAFTLSPGSAGEPMAECPTPAAEVAAETSCAAEDARWEAESGELSVKREGDVATVTVDAQLSGVGSFGLFLAAAFDVGEAEGR
jgi:hypothetical protein